MISAKFVSSEFAYKVEGVLLRGSSSIGNVVTFKVDTGAVCTIISCSTLCGEYNSTYEEKIKEYTMKKGIKPRKFYSASSTEMLGYPVCIPSVRLGKRDIIQNFCYYLVFGIERPICLLGVDVLSCYFFTHSVGGNILMDRFDMELYSRVIKEKYSGGVLMQNEVFELLLSNHEDYPPNSVSSNLDLALDDLDKQLKDLKGIFNN